MLFYRFSILVHHMHMYLYIFFFNDTATTEIYTLSLHDALPILGLGHGGVSAVRLSPGVPDRRPRCQHEPGAPHAARSASDRKSTRLNSSHANISYAVFCLKKKKIYIS